MLPEKLRKVEQNRVWKSGTKRWGKENKKDLGKEEQNGGGTVGTKKKVGNSGTKIILFHTGWLDCYTTMDFRISKFNYFR